MMKQFKKGQAAMEFIMTYGWAIIIVAAALGVISYLGFFRGGNIPEQTTFGEPFVNIDQASITTDGLQISLRNDAADTLTIQNAIVSNNRGGVSYGCDNATADLVGTDDAVATLGTGTKDVSPGERVVISFNGCDNGQEGNRYDAIVDITYNNLYTGLTSNHRGTVKGVITN
jgi:hypothetical protein